MSGCASTTSRSACSVPLKSGISTLSQAGLRAAIWVSAVAMRLGEDSERGKATKGRISTRRLTAIRAALLQAPQLGLQFRRRREQAVGDLGDFLCLPPLPFQPRDLRLLVHRHLQGEPSIGRDAAEAQLAPADVADQSLRPAGALDQAR